MERLSNFEVAKCLFAASLADIRVGLDNIQIRLQSNYGKKDIESAIKVLV